MARYVLEQWDEIPGHWDRRDCRPGRAAGSDLRHSHSLVQHLGAKSLWGGEFHQALDFDPTWKAGRDSVAQGQPLDETTAATAFEAAARACAIEPEPGPEVGAGAGVVIAAGGLRYFVNAWVCIHMLRDKGCTLPIQLWHLGPDELPPALADLVRPLGVECVDALAQLARHPARHLFGWALKSYAILHAPFRHVLWLDADNVPLQDQTFLLTSPPCVPDDQHTTRPVRGRTWLRWLSVITTGGWRACLCSQTRYRIAMASRIRPRYSRRGTVSLTALMAGFVVLVPRTQARAQKRACELEKVISARDHEQLEKLLGGGCDPKRRGRDRPGPLWLASTPRTWRGGSRLLLAHGGDPSRRDPSERTMLHHLSGELDTRLGKLLLSRGANVDAQDKEGDTPLHVAVDEPY